MKVYINFGRSAFSLVEIIIVIGITCSGLLLLSQIFPSGFEAKRRAEDYSTSGVLAQRLLEDIKREGYSNLEKDYPEISSGQGRGEGRFEKYPGFFWEVMWWQMEIPNLRKVRVRVYGNAEEEENASELQIVTYIANRE